MSTLILIFVTPLQTDILRHALTNQKPVIFRYLKIHAHTRWLTSVELNHWIELHSRELLLVDAAYAATSSTAAMSSDLAWIYQRSAKMFHYTRSGCRSVGRRVVPSVPLNSTVCCFWSLSSLLRKFQRIFQVESHRKKLANARSNCCHLGKMTLLPFGRIRKQHFLKLRRRQF